LWNRHDHVDIRGRQRVGPALGCLPGEHAGHQFLAGLLRAANQIPQHAVIRTQRECTLEGVPFVAA
jgi:hypothetical protein